MVSFLNNPRPGRSRPYKANHTTWWNRPDLCDGTYDSYCHMTPSFNNITDILLQHGEQELLEFMDRYWIAAS